MMYEKILDPLEVFCESADWVMDISDGFEARGAHGLALLSFVAGTVLVVALTVSSFKRS